MGSCRCFLYSLLPAEHPYFVLFIEPLHGLTMAAVWSCSVEFGKQLAPKGAEARMQALVAGMYYRVAQGIGAILWGHLTRPPPNGYGFKAMFTAAAITGTTWVLVWNLGW